MLCHATKDSCCLNYNYMHLFTVFITSVIHSKVLRYHTQKKFDVYQFYIVSILIRYFVTIQSL